MRVVLPIFTLAHPDRLLNILLLLPVVNNDILPVGKLFEHRKNLQFFALPRLKILPLIILHVFEVGQRIKSLDFLFNALPF